MKNNYNQSRRRIAKLAIGLTVGLASTAGLAACGSSGKGTVTNNNNNTGTNNPGVTTPVTHAPTSPNTAGGGGVSY